MPNPFTPFANSVFTFNTFDLTQPSTTDSAGNLIPAKVPATFAAFMRPFSPKYPEFNFAPGDVNNKTYLKGFVCGLGKTPSGINPGDRSIYAKYRDQEGTAIFSLNLASSVRADLITGDQIVVVFEVLGGQ